MDKLVPVLIAFAVLFEVIGDILFKYWSINSKSIFIWIGIVVYLIATVIWAYSLKYGFLSKEVTIFTVLNLIAVVLAGVIIFKEQLSPLNIFGILLGIISVILVQI